MNPYPTLIVVIWSLGYCHGWVRRPAKGLVYYPPYIDPSADQNRCTQMHGWENILKKEG